MATKESFERAKQVTSMPAATEPSKSDKTKGEADPEAVKRVQAKQNPKQTPAARSRPDPPKRKKPRENGAKSHVESTSVITNPDPSVPPKVFEPLPFSQAFADHFGLPEAKTEAILDDATLGDLVRAWSALDDVTKDIIAAIVQNRSST